MRENQGIIPDGSRMIKLWALAVDEKMTLLPQLLYKSRALCPGVAVGFILISSSLS